MATGRKKVASKLGLGGESKRVIVAIKVKFELNAKNGLRRILFGLEKDTQGDEVQWKIDFALFEREKRSRSPTATRWSASRWKWTPSSTPRRRRQPRTG